MSRIVEPDKLDRANQKQLGEGLALPPFLEVRRKQIEAGLNPL